MAVQTGGNTHKCVTCQYYGGERDTDGNKRNVRYDSGSDGMCVEKKKEVDANRSACSKWEKWGVLK